MSYYLEIDGEQVGQFATNRGLGDFYRWIASIPVDDVPLLSHLRDSGWVNDLDQLEDELREAMKGEMKESVRTIATGLMENLRARDRDAETVMITNGMGPDDGEPEEWWSNGVRYTNP